jgi:hypothetical protein
VLKGRTTVTGSSKACQCDSAIMSAPILEAEYGDCGWSGCPSVMGAVRAVPYTSLVEVCTSRRTACRRHASATFSVPTTLVWT